jgi:hypothetical protein
MTTGAQEQCSEEIGAIAIGLQLPVLTGEVPSSCHVEEAIATGTIVIDDVKAMCCWLECVLQAVPRFGIELVSWRLITLLDSDVKSHSWR